MKKPIEIRYIVGISTDNGSWVNAEEEVVDKDIFDVLVILKEGGKVVGGKGLRNKYNVYDHNEKWIISISKTDMDFLQYYLVRRVYEYATKELHSMVYLYKVWL